MFTIFLWLLHLCHLPIKSYLPAFYLLYHFSIWLTNVRDFQAVISKEIKAQLLEKESRLPDAVIACAGGGANAIGSFYHFIEDKEVQLIGCEAAGRGIDTFKTAATIATGKLGIFHGMKSYFCQDKYGQITPVYSISAGLDYPGIGPEHAHLHNTKRASYVPVTDDETVCAFEYLAKTEGKKHLLHLFPAPLVLVSPNRYRPETWKNWRTEWL